jgi:hypothetical protein
MNQELNMKPTLNLTVLTALAGIYAVPALAADPPAAPPAPTTLMEAITMGKPLTNFPLRYEYVDQDGRQDNANAWTLRSLIGWQTAPFNNLSFAVQGINVAQFTNEFYDNSQTFQGERTPSNKTQYPVVADPDDTDINQLFVDWTGIKNTKVRLGRQSVKLDNVRFIGNVEFRQVMQVFDGVAVENKSIPNTELYLAHFERVKQISTLLRGGNMEILHGTYRFNPAESLTGYGYLQDMAHNGQNIQNDYSPYKITGTGLSDNSSQTWGLRADGAHKINDDWKFLYTGEYAKQSDYQGGDSLIDAHYYNLGAGAGYGSWYLKLNQELLSSNDGNYAFQTPMGTNHLFQGWADVFLITPKQGIKDTYFTFGGKVMDIELKGEYHWLDADEDFRTGAGTTGDKYGTELDLSAAYTYNKNWMGKLEYANYQADDCYVTSGSCTDTNSNRSYRDKEIFWATMMYTF